MKPTLPIGLAYVAAATREAGHDVRVVDAVAMQPEVSWHSGSEYRVGAGLNAIVEAVPEDIDVIGVGCMFSFQWPFVRELMQTLAVERPGALLVLGGEHGTALPERCLREAPIDAVVLGEGERAFAELIAAGRDWDGVPGVAWLRNGAFTRTEGVRISDPDSLPRPAWDLFEPTTYRENGFSSGMLHGQSIPIFATRGCPYGCTFCTSPNMWGRRWIPRDPIDVVDEMAWLQAEYNATNFPFHDLTALVKREWIVALAEEIVRRGMDIRWQLPTGTRCEVIDDEVAALLYRSGCHYLSFAPESGSDLMRTHLDKQLDRDALFRAVRSGVAAGLHITCFFIIGAPNDTRHDMVETERMARELAKAGVGDISAHFYYPAPGSALYADLGARGRLRGDDEELMAPLLITSTLSERHCYCEHLTTGQLNRWRYRIFASFYGTRFATRPRLALRLARNVIAGRETNKLEAFAREFRARLILRTGYSVRA